MIDKILVGADGSEPADEALASALRIARASEARIRAVHALHRPSLYAPAPGFDPRLLELREETGLEILDEVEKRAGGLGVPADRRLAEGEPGPLLLEAAAEWGADLIAVGSHGRGRVESAIVGSVADHAVRHSPIPVLTAREPAHADLRDPIDRIVVPSDGSPASLEAASFGLELAESSGAEVDLLHAIPPELEGGKYLDRPASEVDEFHEEMVSQALDPLASRFSEAGMGYERFVVHEPAHAAIVEHASERAPTSSSWRLTVAAPSSGSCSAASPTRSCGPRGRPS